MIIMNENRVKRNSMLAQKLIKELKDRNIEAFYAEGKDEARSLALSMIPEGSSVGWGGSMTIDEIGLKDAVIQGNYIEINRDAAASPEIKEKLMRDIFSCDYFLTSCNAISEDGIIVNIDGIGNRIAAIAFGPAHVIIIAGINKVVHSAKDALSRARNEAAPINAQRFDIETPCKKTGACFDCKSPDTICCQFLVTRYNRHPGRIKLILVDDDLGF